MYWKYLKALLRHKWFVFIECVRLGVPLLGILHDWSKFLPSEFIPYGKHFGVGSPVDRPHDMSMDYAWLYHQKRNKHHPEYWSPSISKLHIEQLADFEHEQWRGWMRYQSSKMVVKYTFNNETAVCFPEWARERWERQMDTPYSNLPEEEKASDRAEVYKLFRAIEQFACIPMPDRYRREMLADWRGAGRAYGNPDTRQWYLDNRDKIVLHPETRAWIEEQLGVSND